MHVLLLFAILFHVCMKNFDIFSEIGCWVDIVYVHMTLANLEFISKGVKLHINIVFVCLTDWSTAN